MPRIGRSFPVTPLVADFLLATAEVSGTVTAGIDEDDITAGGETIIITLRGAFWPDTGAPFNDERANIIQGLDAATSPALGWNDEVRDKEVVTAVARTSSTVVTITLTAAGLYDIGATETITVTVPASANSRGVEITAAPTFAVTAVGVAVLPRLALLGVG